MEKAGRVFKQCLRLLGKTNPADEFASGALTEAVAAYHAQNGEWNQAERAWRIGQCFPWFAENAWTGLVKLHAYRGLLQANVAFESARNKFCAETDSLMLPGNNSKRAASAEKEFRRYAKHLAPVIPAKERWRFGL